MTSPLTSPSTQDILEDSDIVHLYCDCDENTALCSVDLTTASETDNEDGLCVVCEDLCGLACPRCGHVPGDEGEGSDGYWIIDEVHW